MTFLDMVNFDREFFVPKILMHICTHQKETLERKSRQGLTQLPLQINSCSSLHFDIEAKNSPRANR